jgi:hypothetical protein
MKHAFTAPVVVWIGPHSPHDNASLQTIESIKGLTLTDPGDDWSSMKYTKVGVGEVTITMDEPDQIIGGKVDSLRAELAKDRADSQVRQNALIRKISELESLTYEPSEAA